MFECALCVNKCRIDTNFIIKISDFGLSEDVFVRNYFRQGKSGEMVKLPIKWMAPESLSDGHFSEKSDVVSNKSSSLSVYTFYFIPEQWSYGVTMWEIFSGGKAPFPGIDPLTLMEFLESGQRMPKPNNTACNDDM